MKNENVVALIAIIGILGIFGYWLYKRSQQQPAGGGVESLSDQASDAISSGTNSIEDMLSNIGQNDPLSIFGI